MTTIHELAAELGVTEKSVAIYVGQLVDVDGKDKTIVGPLPDLDDPARGEVTLTDSAADFLREMHADGNWEDAQVEVNVYEGNSGAVYLQLGDDGVVWELGPVTADLEDRAEELASELAGGMWEPSEDDGQYPYPDAKGLELIAVWTEKDGLKGWPDRMGGGGQRFTGIEAATS